MSSELPPNEYWDGDFIVVSERQRQPLEISVFRSLSRFGEEIGRSPHLGHLFGQADDTGAYSRFAINAQGWAPSSQETLMRRVRSSIVLACDEVQEAVNRVPHRYPDPRSDQVGAIVFPIDSRDPEFVHGLFRSPLRVADETEGDVVVLEGWRFLR